ncbi:MAG: hypothetical protein JWM12_3586 [Ilumatobacteraceae bacterium]|nr:hypothetical protein [Ilumatobacteraceae bacterium]
MEREGERRTTLRLKPAMTPRPSDNPVGQRSTLQDGEKVRRLHRGEPTRHGGTVAGARSGGRGRTRRVSARRSPSCSAFAADRGAHESVNVTDGTLDLGAKRLELIAELAHGRRPFAHRRRRRAALRCSFAVDAVVVGVSVPRELGIFALDEGTVAVRLGLFAGSESRIERSLARFCGRGSHGQDPWRSSCRGVGWRWRCCGRGFRRRWLCGRRCRGRGGWCSSRQRSGCRCGGGGTGRRGCRRGDDGRGGHGGRQWRRWHGRSDRRYACGGGHQRGKPIQRRCRRAPAADQDQCGQSRSHTPCNHVVPRPPVRAQHRAA